MGEKCRANAAHFKLVYEEPKALEIKFLTGVTGTGKSSFPIYYQQLKKRLPQNSPNSIYVDTEVAHDIKGTAGTCIVCDHVGPPTYVKPTWSPAKAMQALGRMDRTARHADSIFAIANAASGLKDPESK